MSDLAANEKIEKACRDARDKFEKLGDDFTDIKAKLDWVLGSYNYDKNPVGLYDIGAQALEALREFKKEKPRQVSKKLVDELEKALQSQN